MLIFIGIWIPYLNIPYLTCIIIHHYLRIKFQRDKGNVFHPKIVQRRFKLKTFRLFNKLL